MRNRWLRIAPLCLLVASMACGSDPLPGPNGGGGDAGGNPEGNRSPVINPVSPQTVSEGDTLRVVFAVTDPDGDTMYLEAHDVPDGAFFNPVQGTFAYTPDFDVVTGAEGSLTLPDVRVTVDDNYLLDETVVSITVQHVNRAPFFLGSDGAALSEIALEVDPGAERRVGFQVIDADDDPISLQLNASPAYARLDGHVLVATPAEADRGSVAEFDITAFDGTENATLPVRVVVGSLDAQLPPPTGLSQSARAEDVAIGGTAFEGTFTFGAAAHSFEFGPLRLQAQVAALGTEYEDGQTAIGDPLPMGAGGASVNVQLAGDVDYRWRARYLSDEFGAGPYASFGGNAETDADLAVSIVPTTVLDGMPHDPSPVDVTFEYYSPNVADFECLVDDGDWFECSNYVTCCPGDDCGERDACADDGCTCAEHTIIGLGNGPHSFSVRGVTRDALPDPDPPTFEWDALDLPEPETIITQTPSEPVLCSAEFRFTSGDETAVFECRLDYEEPPPSGFVGNFLPCMSPRTYTELETGAYRFHVRAVNLVGIADSTPQTHPFNASCD